MRFVYEADSAADYETSDSRGGGRTGADRDAVYDSPVRRAGGVGKQRTYRKRAAGGGSGQRTWRDFSQSLKCFWPVIGFVDIRGSFARFFMIDLSLERQVYYYAKMNVNLADRH